MSSSLGNSVVLIRLAGIGLCLMLSLGAARAASPEVERGRYLIVIGGCNDCHTAGYIQSEGKAPVETWLLGDKLGWRGPWGTTYPRNLRLYMKDLSEDDWVEVARTFTPRPPMPWFNLRVMTEEDLRAMYKFVRSLGPVGEPEPEYVPPDQEPQPPYVQFP